MKNRSLLGALSMLLWVVACGGDGGEPGMQTGDDSSGDGDWEWGDDDGSSGDGSGDETGLPACTNSVETFDQSDYGTNGNACSVEISGEPLGGTRSHACNSMLVTATPSYDSVKLYFAYHEDPGNDGKQVFGLSLTLPGEDALAKLPLEITQDTPDIEGLLQYDAREPDPSGTETFGWDVFQCYPEFTAYRTGISDVRKGMFTLSLESAIPRCEGRDAHRESHTRYEVHGRLTAVCAEGAGNHDTVNIELTF